MNLKELVDLKSKFVAREVGNEMILVPLTNNVAQMSELFTLNETAGFIWENSTEDITIEKLVALMTDSFEIDKITAERDINNFLNHLEKTFH
ncbi:MAG: PqqD family protein [Paludibacter sp.]|nr:PqqD family protein [Paludibacter sp.]